MYAISVAGLALIPGVDGEGHRAPMSIFHAFYVMSYTATTIGFGEIPYPFTDAQRLWVTFAIYLSVTGWAYTLGSVIALANDAPFRALMARGLFNWRARGIGEPFYVLCGYGQSGARLARAMDRLGDRLVILDPSAERVARIAIQDFATPPLTLTDDARLADVLEDAGVRNPLCRGLIALAGEDSVNQAIAIGARVLSPTLRIVARAKSDVAKVNLESFGGVLVTSPFETFADKLRVAIRAPGVVQIEDWLTASAGAPCPERVQPPAGRWVLIGFGRFGRSVARMLDAEGIEWKAFDPSIEEDPEGRLLHGDYTEGILRDAGIASASVLVAGADSDAVNLGATTLARRVKADIFVVIRQNQSRDRALVDAAKADIKFDQATLTASECLQCLKAPMLARFIAHLRDAGDTLCGDALARIRREVGDGAPRPWTFECDVLGPGMFHAFFQRGGAPFTIGHLTLDPTDPRERMRCAALMLERDGAPILLPADDTQLRPGDRLLFVGEDGARRLQQRYASEPGTVAWVCSGTEPARGYVFRWLQQRFGPRA